jgi:hypothetical protein
MRHPNSGPDRSAIIYNMGMQIGGLLPVSLSGYRLCFPVLFDRSVIKFVITMEISTFWLKKRGPVFVRKLPDSAPDP